MMESELQLVDDRCYEPHMTMRSIFVVVSIVLIGCGGAPKPTTYGGHAQQTYELGKAALEDGNYLDANQHFISVKNKYPYSQFAALAELRIGDGHYAQDKFVEAIGAYRAFVQRRPNNGEVAHALWRIGESYFQQRPSSFFLFPPGYEKDRSATKDAVRSYTDYLARFPKHTHVADAQTKLNLCRTALADYQLYVAKFYIGQERPRSAIGRLNTVFAGFEDVPVRWREASVLLLDIYVRLGGPKIKDPIKNGWASADKVAHKIIAKFPKTDEAKIAKRALGTMAK
jgi:outer membrane protein assembly factor BamD